MKAVFSALKAEQKRLAKELKKVEGLMSRAGVSGTARRKKVVRRKKAVAAVETKAGAKKAKKGGAAGGGKRAAKTLNEDLDEVEEMRLRKARRQAEQDQD